MSDVMLEAYGLVPELRASLEATLEPGEEIGRILAVNRTNLNIVLDAGTCLAELTGRLRYAADSELDLPAVGDWVATRGTPDFAVVTRVLDRTSELKRRRPGSKAEYQLFAANVDLAFMVHGCNLPVNVRRLERFCALARDGAVEPVIVLAKVDLLTPEEQQDQASLVQHLGPTVLVSSVESDGLAPLTPLLSTGKTFALLGPSGAGKTTLLNRLLDSEVFATGDVRSGDGKGKHTTTRRELVLLPDGALLVDTPGVRELGMTDMKEGIEETFSEIADLAEECRFGDCTHTVEAGCAVLAAVDAGDLSEDQVASFLKLEREAAHYERSVADRRKRDKAFGKMIKTVLKGKKDRR